MQAGKEKISAPGLEFPRQLRKMIGFLCCGKACKAGCVETEPGPIDREPGPGIPIIVSVRQAQTEDSHGGTDTHSHSRSLRGRQALESAFTLFGPNPSRVYGHGEANVCLSVPSDLLATA